MSALITLKDVLHDIEDNAVELSCFKFQFMELNHIHLAIIDSWDMFVAITIRANQTGGTWSVDRAVPVWKMDWPERNIRAVGNPLDVAEFEFKMFKSNVRSEQANMDIIQLDACGKESGKLEKSFAHVLFNQQISLWSPSRDGWGIKL